MGATDNNWMDQSLKFRLSNNWGSAQVIFYADNPIIRDSTYFTEAVRVAGTIKSFIDMGLVLQNDRYDALHGVTLQESEGKKKEKVI